MKASELLVFFTLDACIPTWSGAQTSLLLRKA